MKIKHATAIYTGGGIYIYYGQLNNGLYFRAGDGWEWISICDADTSVDDANYIEFYEEHEIENLVNDDYVSFWNNMLKWIIDNKPDGNYISCELEDRITKTNSDNKLYLLIDEQTDFFDIIETNAPTCVVAADIRFTDSALKYKEEKQARKLFDGLGTYPVIMSMGFTVYSHGTSETMEREDIKKYNIYKTLYYEKE